MELRINYNNYTSSSSNLLYPTNRHLPILYLIHSGLSKNDCKAFFPYRFGVAYYPLLYLSLIKLSYLLSYIHHTYYLSYEQTSFYLISNTIKSIKECL